MPRRSRLILPGVPHHVTQRGSRRQDVFFEERDYQLYLDLLAYYSRQYGVEIIGYCLMTNHVHHMLVPLEKDSLRWTLQLTHKTYAECTNRREGWTGHLWQQRFYSCPVDENYFWIAMRYIERNPVEAHMVSHSAKYRWSSAAHHCGMRNDDLLTKEKKWVELVSSRAGWFDWLSQPDSDDQIRNLKKLTSRDLPCGSDSFLDFLERTIGISSRPPKMGRPKSEKS